MGHPQWVSLFLYRGDKMAILKIRDANGNTQEILAIKGEDGKDYVLTDADKQEIAEMVAASVVATVDVSSYLTEEDVLALIRENMPSSAEGVEY